MPSVSIGVAAGGAQVGAELVVRADQALRIATNAGRTTWRFDIWRFDTWRFFGGAERAPGEAC